MKCRHCNTVLELSFVDLASSPPSNAYLSIDRLNESEPKYPLRVLYCDECWLVQTEDFASAEELFDAEYAYFSSFSKTWLEHSELYAKEMIKRLSLSSSSCVVEVAANDGYLLQYFQKEGIPNYGIEPTNSTAKAAREKGIDIVEEFFGEQIAESLKTEERSADLMIANNVLAHVPDINDFIKGFSILLKPEGVATFEFPHLCKLVENSQFDTIYHEHYSYLSLCFVKRLFESNGLEIFDVDEITTHGGSLRVYVQKNGLGVRQVEQRVPDLMNQELKAGVISRQYYEGFQIKTDKVCSDFKNFVLSSLLKGNKVAAYGAAAKGNTLLNYSGLTSDHISYVVDLNPQKQGKLLPGSHVPIVSESHLKNDKPDIIIIFPWNLLDELRTQLSYVSQWGGEFVIALPELKQIKA